MTDRFHDHSHQPRKKFGQNFLKDKFIIERIVDSICPQQDDHVVEIGPGLGALTKQLLTRIDELDVIEIDKELIPRLNEINTTGKLTIFEQDVLSFNFSKLFEKHQKLLRVVGNLPYNISTPLLFYLFTQKDYIRDMHFMLQKEVADRLAAKPDRKEYGRLSVMAQYHCKIELLFDVAPEAFWPRPKVFSTVLRLIPEKHPFVVKDTKLFNEVVRLAFNQRRKTIKNCLKNFLTQQEFTEIDIDPQLRPEQISLEKYVKITNKISTKS